MDVHVVGVQHRSPLVVEAFAAEDGLVHEEGEQHCQFRSELCSVDYAFWLTHSKQVERFLQLLDRIGLPAVLLVDGVDLVHQALQQLLVVSDRTDEKITAGLRQEFKLSMDGGVFRTVRGLAKHLFRVDVSYWPYCLLRNMRLGFREQIIVQHLDETDENVWVCRLDCDRSSVN